MPRRFQRSYIPEFRQQMVDLVRAGRTPEELDQKGTAYVSSLRRPVGQLERPGLNPPER